MIAWDEAIASNIFSVTPDGLLGHHDFLDSSWDQDAGLGSEHQCGCNKSIVSSGPGGVHSRFNAIHKLNSLPCPEFISSRNFHDYTN